jgi:hypothetical protein
MTCCSLSLKGVCVSNYTVVVSLCVSYHSFPVNGRNFCRRRISEKNQKDQNPQMYPVIAIVPRLQTLLNTAA